jgi:hypothetical protein
MPLYAGPGKEECKVCEIADAKADRPRASTRVGRNAWVTLHTAGEMREATATTTDDAIPPLLHRYM